MIRNVPILRINKGKIVGKKPIGFVPFAGRRSSVDRSDGVREVACSIHVAPTMKTIKQTYHINAPIKEVWKALTDQKYIESWGGGPVKMNEKVGAKFEFWGGDIHGTNTAVINPPTGGKKLVQDWYGGDWPQPSKVTFILKELTDGETRVDLIHENLPDDKTDDIADGWKRYYLGPMKNYLEK